MKITLLLNRSYFSRRWLGIPALVYLSLFAQYAVADAGDTFNVTAGTTFLYDTNVFRSDPLIPPALVTGKDTRADQIITTTATLSVNKLYSMQRFEINASLVDNRYNNFDYLNFLGKNGTATWHWYLTPYLYGRLTGNHREALQNFADITGFLTRPPRICVRIIMPVLTLFWSLTVRGGLLAALLMTSGRTAGCLSRILTIA